MTVAGGVVDPSAFVVNGNLLMVAERFNQDTVLTEIDMSKVTTVSTQLSGKVRLVATWYRRPFSILKYN